MRERIFCDYRSGDVAAGSSVTQKDSDHDTFDVELQKETVVLAQPIRELWFASKKLPNLDFPTACKIEANNPTTILFAGPLRTACKYIYEGHLYRVQLNDNIQLIDGFASYHSLCAKVQELDTIVFFKENEWRRKSSANTDYRVFEQLDSELNSQYHGIVWYNKFRNFHDEVILFRSAPVEYIEEKPTNCCDQLLALPSKAPTVHSSNKKRRVEPTRVS